MFEASDGVIWVSRNLMKGDAATLFEILNNQTKNRALKLGFNQFLGGKVSESEAIVDIIQRARL